jgi:nicotinamidase-related amidase
MNPALLLIDLQRHFLDSPGLQPPQEKLISSVAELLSLCRKFTVPVFHVHTLIKAHGHDRMPHWKRADLWACVEGTPDALPPPPLAPGGDESVIRKTFYSAFGNPIFSKSLKSRRIDTLIVAGLHLHACVRSSVMDAYERGYEVWLAQDAVATNDPQHGAHTLRFLEGRAAVCLSNAVISGRLAAMGRHGG